MSKLEPLAVTVERTIDASPEVVYDLISDITRMNEFSTENTGGEWLGNASEPAVGARFKGTNTIGSLRWSTKPTITAAERGRQFAFQVPGRSGALWTYRFDAVDSGTRVVESMCQQRPSPLPIRILQRRAGITDRGEHLRAGMAATLERLAAVAETPDLAFR